MGKFLRKYMLFSVSLTGLLLMAVTFFTSHAPLKGYLALGEIPPSSQFAYIPDQSEMASLKDWMTRQRSFSFMIGADRWNSNASLANAYFFPVFDGTRTVAAFSRSYSRLPAESLPGMGKTVYSLDFGTVRLIFLNSFALNDNIDSTRSQLNYLQRQTMSGEKPINIALISEPPFSPEFWERLQTGNVQLLLAGKRFFVRSDLISGSKTDELGISPSRGNVGSNLWEEWIPKHLDKPYLLAIRADETQLYLRAQNVDGQLMDELPVELWKRMTQSGTVEIPVVSSGSFWNYRALHSDAADWQKVNFNDREWTVGRAPFTLTEKIPHFRYDSMTVLSLQSDAMSYGFRKTFVVNDDPKRVRKGFLRLSYEDGIIVYLNGEEILRDALPEGAITPQTPAMPNEAVIGRLVVLEITPGSIKHRMNTLAVELHRSDPQSRNLLFDLGLSYAREETY